ncbi:MAG: hypothetical protein ACLR8X_13570 [Gallintestinimicrobium sp.]
MQLKNVIAEIQKAFERFQDLEKLAFDENINIAFQNSVYLAVEAGVEENKILKTQKDIDDYFLN